jgi:hypothetical protein
MLASHSKVAQTDGESLGASRMIARIVDVGEG